MSSNRNKIWQQVHVALALYLGLAMLLYTLARILFFVLNRELFEATSLTDFAWLLLAGMRFDLSAVLYTNLLFILLLLLPFPFRYHKTYLKVAKYIFIISNSITLLANLSDIIYYRYTLRRTTWSVLSEFANENMARLASSFAADFWYILLIWVALVGLTVWLYGKIKVSAPQRINPWIYYPAHTLVLGLVLGLCVAGMRGGFRHSTRPITLSNAGEYVSRPNEMYLVLNTPFSMLRTINKADFKKVAYFNQRELASIYSPIHQPTDTAAFQPKNVVIIVLESFSKEAVGGYNSSRIGQDGYQGFTPFMDKLMQESKVYWYSFANGKKSIDALPSVLTSIPSLQEPFVLTPYAGNHLPSLPRLLNEKGYHTAFFHGAPNGSMGFKAFMNLIGVQEYYGKDEYNNDADFDGIWGIWDEPFLQFTANKINTFQEPFMSAVFTLSSHHPFKVPERYEGKFRKGPLPVYECISYTDMALQKFFEKASTMSWYKNTLFVISADHTATAKYYPEYQSAWGAFAIPILFYAPGDPSFKGVEKRVVQQLDIMPTVLGYLHYDKPYFAYGKDMLTPDHSDDFAINYLGAYQWFEGEYMIQFDGEKTTAMYNYVNDILLKTDLKDQLPEKRRHMENRVKAFIQQYNNRMVDDNLQVGVVKLAGGR
ncbi:LTA synthase family protein [Pontibacter sp. 172403-2]|uniref:LTA synthase family protein n=1 Tax=Pontibacter rufus TaxID=2791028 RepID=UPI0018AF9647|nr:LTA synthase family protein [Pontibacter sp. 172403-2]MBF9255291.1 LTA synthase family protein [Pontibacter sp. 172403-2]